MPRCRWNAGWLVLAAGAELALAGPVTIHVSPSGDDRATGADAAHALATPAGARDRIRAIRAERGGALPGPITVELGAGTYRLAAPLVLSPGDSGVEGSPITYRAGAGEGGEGGARGAEVVISGGRMLPAWREAELDGRKVWAAECTSGPEIAPTVRELWVGGRRGTRARQPDTGYLRMQDVPQIPKDTPWNQGQKHFRYREEDSALWRTVRPGTSVVAFTRWVDAHLCVESVEAEGRIAMFTRPAQFLFRPGDQYWLEGERAFMDAPGEWWHDRGAGVMYYLPRPGETPDRCAGEIAWLGELVVVAGDPEHGAMVHDISLEGLTFAHATWWFPEDVGAAAKTAEPLAARQAAVVVPGAIRMDGAERVALRGCTIAHVGGYGLELGRGCRDNTISRCTITDLGAGGVKIGETTIREAESDRTARNTVSDCTITDGGRVHHEGVGVLITQSDANVIEHNRIADFDYTGVSIGWTWGYGPSRAGGNLVRFNEIGPIGTHPEPDGPPGARTSPPLGDMGGVYTLGAQPGTVISDNLIHDVRGHTIAWGIYFDEGTAGVVAERNVVMGTTHGSFHQHYGRDNALRNNLFMDPGEAVLWVNPRQNNLGAGIERNVIVAPASGAAFKYDWSQGVFTFTGNAYVYTDKPPVFPAGKGERGDWPKHGRTLEQWQEAGQDRGAVVVRMDAKEAADAASLIARFPEQLRGVNPRAAGPRP